MADVSRRQFLRNASLAAATTGVMAAGGVGLFQAASAAGANPATPATPAALDSSAKTPTLEGSDVFAHVVDARSGQITIFVGTKAVSYTSRDLAQRLLQAAR